MVTQYRVDIGGLAKPVKTPQGFLIVEGIASRTGIFEYQRADGSIQKELRLPTEVFSGPAMSGYQGAPVTKGHPAVPVDARNAKRVSVGAVLEPARQDGDQVRVRMVVQDQDAVSAMESGRMRALSTGYSIDYDPTPGVHPVFGRYDGVQRNLVINHLALCESGRAGPTARVRMDAKGKRVGERPESWTTGWRRDAGMMVNGMGVEGSMQSYEPPGDAGTFVTGGTGAERALLTTESDGHQHLIDDDMVDDGVGCTSWATSEGADNSHNHNYIRNADGSYTISMNEGHGHDVVVPSSDASSNGGTTTDSLNTHPRGKTRMQTRNNATGQGTGAGSGQSGASSSAAGRQPPRPARQQPRSDEERALLEVAGTELAAARLRADTAEKKLTTETARADAAEGAYEATLAKLEKAEGNLRDDALIAEKDAEIERLVRQVDDLRDDLDAALAPARVDALVRERARIERAAGPILGLDKMDGITDRDLMVAVVERLQGEPCKDKSQDYVKARFDVAIQSHARGARALDSLRELVPLERTPRGDRQPVAQKSARDRYLDGQQNGWKPAADAKGA